MAKPGSNGKDRQRCGARVRHRHGFCRKWPVPGKTRCRFHGGLSTGAITEDGKARSLAAMHDGWQRWHEEMRAKKAAGEIDRFPGGRKSGARWVTPRMRELREIEAMRRVQDARAARALSLAGAARLAPLGPGGRGPARSGEKGAQGETAAGFVGVIVVSKADYCLSTAQGQGRLSQVRVRGPASQHDFAAASRICHRSNSYLN